MTQNRRSQPRPGGMLEIIVGTVLDALSAPAGAEDTRTQGQRCHDALQEAMRLL